MKRKLVMFFCSLLALAVLALSLLLLGGTVHKPFVHMVAPFPDAGSTSWTDTFAQSTFAQDHDESRD